ncbi:MAG: DUF1512 family protein [Candidatus Aenigmatarchaeota archaeon]
MMLQIDTIFWIFFIIFLFLYPIIYPRVIISYALMRIESLTSFISSQLNFLKNEIRKRNPKDIKKIEEILDFFIIQPTSLDPFGIVKKIDYIVKKGEEKIRSFVNDMFDAEKEAKRNLEVSLQILIELNTLKKVLEHFAQLIKKMRNIQYAMLVQMYLPLYEKIAKAYSSGCITVLKNSPIGDGIGPLVVSKLITKKDKIHEEKDCIIVKKRINNKRVILVRAKGPGSRLGRLHEVVENLVKKYKPKKIVTIDAAAKLEGEKTGSIAKGIGVAIGGLGVEKFNIEEIAVKYGIELEAIVIKMSAEEAIKPMHPDVFNASQKAVEILKEIISESKDPILIIGVGNSAGIYNTDEENINLEKTIKENWEKYGKEEEKVSWLDKLFGIE